MKCETCRWWSAGENEAEGECRDAPPNTSRQWPKTQYYHWCGHWQGHVLEELKSDDNKVSGGETVELEVGKDKET